MSRDRSASGDPAREFPTTPVSFRDAAGREIDVRAYGEGPIGEEVEAMVSMYDNFDPADRAQGLPPSREGAIREWLDVLLGEDAVNVLAWHGEFVAGHATLVPDDPDHELAIFVHHQYQGAGVGSCLLECLLGEGRERGVEHVWLTVERWNTPAVNLYRNMGFETTTAENFELEMGLRLDEGEESDGVEGDYET